MAPEVSRSSAERTLIEAPWEPSTRLTPLNCAAPTTWPIWLATVTVELPSDRLFEMPMNPVTSEFICVEMAQTAALSMALETDFPVEIWFCTPLS